MTIGNFDGVHRGTRGAGRAAGGARTGGGWPAVVFTFDPHPAQLLYPAAVPPPLTWTERKAELLGALGVDAVIAYPTDRAVLSLSADEFFARGFCATSWPRGRSWRARISSLAATAAASIDYLGQLCAAAGVRLEVVEPLVGGRGLRVEQPDSGADPGRASAVPPIGC